MKRFLLSISALLLLTTFTLHAEQNDAPLPTFHTLSVSPHYGQMHYDINLYHLQDPDFDWSFLLSYTSDGFRPFAYSGQVGENWSLQVGGSVTREIIGIADDEHYAPASASTSSKRRGLLVALRELPVQDLGSASLFETVPSFVYDSGEVDLQSDIYTFSCNGYSGRFIIGLDGKAHVLSGDYVSVDLSGMTTQVKNNDSSREIFIHPDVSTISFTTLDGYRYVFGGNIDALGYSFSKLSNAVSSDDEPLYQKADITQWLLTSVIAPNGRRINFHYKPIGTEMDNNCTQYAYSYTSEVYWKNEYNNEVREDCYLSDTLNLISVTDKIGSRFFLKFGYRVFEKIPFLDSITTSDHSFSVHLSYATLPNQICDNGFVFWDNDRNTGYKSYWTAKRHFLSRIMVRSATSVLSQWNLSYHQLSVSPVTRQYLQSVTHNSGIQYTFDYNIAQPSAAIDRFDSIDMAGYKISNPTFGTLSRITDPLGCVTTLEFQPCKYDSIRIFKQEGTSIRSTIQAYDQRDLVHPIAVTTIRKTASDGKLLSSKQYEYGYHIDMVGRAETSTLNNESSVVPPLPTLDQNYGIVNVDFAIDISSERAQRWSKQRHYAVCPYFTPSGSNASPIEFPLVKEYIYDSNNKLLYRNEYSFDRTEDKVVTNRQSNNNDFHRILGAYSYLSQEYRRSRLSVKQEYDNSGTIRRKTINLYCPIDVLSDNADHAFHTPCTTPWRTEYAGGVAYKVFFTGTRIAEQQITHYEANGTYTTRTTYEYDAKHRLTRTGVRQGDTETFTRHRYPDDVCAVSFNGNDPYVQGYCRLVRTHRIATPVETVQGISRNGQSFVTSGGIVMYDVAPCAVLNLALSEPIAERDYTGLSVLNGQLRYDSRYETASTCTYDSHLRLTSTTPMGQPTTTYIWDDKWLNITSETTGAFTTRYTHIPYVGVSSVTSPQGITTYYTYDTLGNVTEVYQYHNGKKVILQAYKYHYQSQQ